MFSKQNRFLTIVLILLILTTALFAQTIQENRKYEPIVVPPYKLAQFYGIPVDELFMYVYHQDSQSWELIPFQIDEVTKDFDPLNPSDSLLFYFIPDEWDIDDHDGVLSQHDELVFLICDLGNQAPQKAWIDNEESKLNPRLEIVIEDPIDNHKAYGYLFHSSTISEPIPKPYNLESDTLEDKISSEYYMTKIGQVGLIEDIIIKEPYGNGKDIFDTQKLRFSGILDLGIGPVELFMTEKNLYLYEEKKYTPNPVVRIVRQVKMTLQLGSFVSHNTPFWLRTKFYPFSGEFVGGASIAKDALKEFWPGSDAVVIMHDLRQSWDFDSSSIGMKFYNRYNDGVVIDGSPDYIRSKIDVPIQEWNSLTGPQGSFFTLTKFNETKWQNIILYYWDSEQGGQFDQSIFIGVDDTGEDKKSFGDHGILFQNYGKDDISLALNFFAYFIPQKNIEKNEIEQFSNRLLNPVTVSSSIVTDVVENKSDFVPTELKLFQNSPNPVNSVTTISFFIPQREQIKVEIRDLNGRLVDIITDKPFSTGRHKIIWDGKNFNNENVSAGVYFVVLKSNSSIKSQKLTIIK